MPARPARGLVSEVGNYAVVRRSSLDYIYFGPEQCTMRCPSTWEARDANGGALPPVYI